MKKYFFGIGGALITRFRTALKVFRSTGAGFLRSGFGLSMVIFFISFYFVITLISSYFAFEITKSITKISQPLNIENIIIPNYSENINNIILINKKVEVGVVKCSMEMIVKNNIFSGSQNDTYKFMVHNLSIDFCHFNFIRGDANTDRLVFYYNLIGFICFFVGGLFGFWFFLGCCNGFIHKHFPKIYWKILFITFAFILIYLGIKFLNLSIDYELHPESITHQIQSIITQLSYFKTVGKI